MSLTCEEARRALAELTSADLVALCEACGIVYENHFPCFCGRNTLSDGISEKDMDKFNKILELIEGIPADERTAAKVIWELYKKRKELK